MPRRIRVFDAHLHIINPRFPLVANRGYLPAPFDCSTYLQRMREFDLVGGAIVSGSFQAFDQSYLVHALKQLGPGFVGVTQLPATAPDAQILQLHAAGVRGVRFNLYRGGSEDVSLIQAMAWRIWELARWHVELYAGADALRELYPLLVSLPKVSIDHLGMQQSGLPLLLRLAGDGVHIKASGFGRVDMDIVAAMRAVHTANPAALMVGTDLPGTRAPRPFRRKDLDRILEAVGEQDATAVFTDNALSFYGIQGHATDIPARCDKKVALHSSKQDAISKD